MYQWKCDESSSWGMSERTSRLNAGFLSSPNIFARIVRTIAASSGRCSGGSSEKHGGVDLGEDPHVIRRQGRIRDERDECGSFCDDSALLFPLLRDQRAGEALRGLGEEFSGTMQAIDHLAGDDRQSDDLRVRVLLRGARVRAVIFEQDDVPDSRIGAKGLETMAIRFQDALHLFDRQLGQREMVLAGFEQYFVKTHAIDGSFTGRCADRRSQVARRRKDGEFVDDGTNGPVPVLVIDPVTFIIEAAFVAGTERARCQMRWNLRRLGRAREIGPAFGPLGRNDDPLASEAVLTNFRHGVLGSFLRSR